MIRPFVKPGDAASAETVTVVCAVAPRSPSETVQASTYVPATVKVARVAAANGGSNHTPPGPDTRTHFTRSAPGCESASATDAASGIGSGSVPAAVSASPAVGVAFSAGAAIRVTATSSVFARRAPATVARKTYVPSAGSVTAVTTASGVRIDAPSPETHDHRTVPSPSPSAARSSAV